MGYGGTFEASRPSRIGIVACGYADGYPRHAPSGTPILVNGRRTTTVGRVSMDMLACDLTDIPDAGVDIPVVVITSYSIHYTKLYECPLVFQSYSAGKIILINKP